MPTGARVVAQAVKAVADSIHALREAIPAAAPHVEPLIVEVATDSAHPLVTKAIEDEKVWALEKVLTLIGLIVIPLLAAWIGGLLGAKGARDAGLEAQEKAAKTERELRAEEREHERQVRESIELTQTLKAQHDSARLARRYLLLGKNQLQALVNRYNNNTLTEASVSYVQRTISDFGEVKTRMIALNNDDVEEAIFQWHIVTMDDLTESHDAFTMQEDHYFARYGVKIAFAREGGRAAALLHDVIEADRVLLKLKPFLKKDNG